MKDEVILPSDRAKQSSAPSPEAVSDAWSAGGPRGLRARARAWLGLGPATKARRGSAARKAADPARASEMKPASVKNRAEKPASRPSARHARPLDGAPAVWRGFGGRRAVPPIENFLLILGAMKSGTTSLYDYLATHPEIASCRRKEPSFFAADRRARLPGRYFRLWPGYDPARHRYAMEASVDYTKQPRYHAVSRRIARFPARFRYIYIVRDPVDRIESHIAHNIAKGRVTAEDHGRMLPSALSISRYGYQLDRFRAGAGDPEILVLDFDELRNDPTRLLGRVVDFLGIDPGFAFAPRQASNTRRPASTGFRLSPEERAGYHAALAPDMAWFARRYGFDVARWGFTPEAYPEAFATPDPVAPVEPGEASAPSASYWDRRRDLIYYKYIRSMMGRLSADSQSLIDVGSYNTSLSEEFDWIPERFALDIREPYSSAKVQGISADFLTFEPGRRYDFATCFQVLEHIDDAGAFAKKLLSVADRVLVSVPYLWPEGQHPQHVQDPVDEAKLASWFGRAPNYQIVVQEPLREGGFSRRLIAYFDTVSRRGTFDPRKLPRAPEPVAVPADPSDPTRPKRRRGTGYWKKRRSMIYYDYVRAMVRLLAAKAERMIDVGSHQTSLIEEFDWIPRRVALDIRKPYSSERVRGIRRDFLTFTPKKRYDFATCFQVLEHIDDAGAFAKKLLSVADRVLVSVPYRWPEGSHSEHVQDPVDEAKLASWFGRAPDYQLVVREPLGPDKKGRWLIAYYHNDPSEPFSLRKAGKRAAEKAAARAAREAEKAERAARAKAREEARAAKAARAEARAAAQAGKAARKAAEATRIVVPAPAPAALPDAAASYWDRRRDLIYYKYIRSMMGRLAADSQSLIDVGSYNTSLSEEFDWIPERFALDIREPYSSAKVQGISADFLTFEPGRRYDFATCFQVLEHIDDAGAFAKKLLSVADRVLVSVPYLWPEGQHPQHVQDPVDEAKLASWFGRAPNYQIVVQEPLREGGFSRRLIAYFDAAAAPGPFDPSALPPAPPARAPAAAGYWDERRDMIYYDYVRAMVGRLAAEVSSLIDVGSNETSLAEEFGWIPERFALDLETVYASANVQGITADFLTFEPGRRYDFATCFQVLEHVPEAGDFAKKLLAVADRVLISVPYRWPETRHPEHVHDPVTEEKLDGWFGRAPDYRLIVREPLRRGMSGRRMIAYYHNVPGETFALRAPKSRARRDAPPSPADAQRPA